MIGNQFPIGFSAYKDAYIALSDTYKVRLNEKFTAQYTGEDAKGIDCTLSYVEVLWVAFYYLGLMHKDIVLGMTLEDAEIKYNITRLRYVLSCYKIYLSDLYDAFGITSATAAPFIPITTLGQQTLMIGDMGGLSKILRLDGVDDTAIAPANINNSITTNDFAVELRFKIHSITGSPAIVSNISGTKGFEIGINGTGVYIKLVSGTAFTATFGIGEIALNTWYDLLINFDRSGNATLYINGRLEDTVSIASKNGLSLSASGDLLIGSRTTDSVYTYMSIDRVRLYTMLFTDTEVLNLYLTGEVPLEYISYVGFQYDSDSLGHYTWIDKTSKAINLVIDGATLYNIPSGDDEVYEIFEASSDIQIENSLSGYMITKIIVINTDATSSCTLDIGTTVGGDDILSAISVSPFSTESYTIATYYGNTSMYISGTWNGCIVTFQIHFKAI